MEVRIDHRMATKKMATKTGAFECAFCYAKYNTPEERMECEKECSAKKHETEHERSQDFDLISKELELIRNKYKKVMEHVKQHNIKYNDSTVILDGTGEESVFPLWNGSVNELLNYLNNEHGDE